MKQVTKIKISMRPYPLLDSRERILIWESVRGMWKGKKPEPVKESREIRKGWERDLSSI